MATSRPATTQCKTCEKVFAVTNAMGPIRQFCSAACKPSRAYTAGAKSRVARSTSVVSSAAKARRGGVSERPRDVCEDQQPDPPRDRTVTVTSETEYSDDEAEFIKAVDRFKREKKRPFPALSELLGVLKGLGYRKGTADGLVT